MNLRKIRSKNKDIILLKDSALDDWFEGRTIWNIEDLIIL
jgi:hypothetical protein